MKKALITAILSAALLLSGCAGDKENSTIPENTILSNTDTLEESNSEGVIPDDPPRTAEILDQTSESSENQVFFPVDIDFDKTNIINDLCGESISLEFDERMNKVMDNIGSPSRFYVYEDFGYYVPSDGRVVYKHMLSPSDYPDDETISRMLDRSNFQRINKGEELCGLTLKSAKGVLQVDENGETQLTRQWLDFSGSITLNGFVYIFADDEDAGYFTGGDVFFLADKDEWTGLPFNERYMSRTQWGADSSFYWAATAPVINLGNLSDYDISSLSDNQGKISEATVTIGDLSLRNDLNDIAYSYNWDVNMSVIENIEFK